MSSITALGILIKKTLGIRKMSIKLVSDRPNSIEDFTINFHLNEHQREIFADLVKARSMISSSIYESPYLARSLTDLLETLSHLFFHFQEISNERTSYRSI